MNKFIAFLVCAIFVRMDALKVYIHTEMSLNKADKITVVIFKYF